MVKSTLGLMALWKCVRLLPNILSKTRAFLQSGIGENDDMH
jgi:hypothetical protein